jgi:hypothetical protein
MGILMGNFAKISTPENMVLVQRLQMCLAEYITKNLAIASQRPL